MILDELKKLNNSRQLKDYAEYLNISPETVSRWEEIPRQYHRRTCERCELQNDKVMDFIDLLDLKR